MTAGPVLLAAYGTLMTGQRNGLDPGVRARMRDGRPCRIPGRIYEVREVAAGPDGPFRYPALVACPEDPDATVHGEAFVIGADAAEAAAVLAATDRYEDCIPGDPGRSTYLRLIRPVLVDGVARPAWVYLYNRPVDRLPPIGGGRWG